MKSGTARDTLTACPATGSQFEGRITAVADVVDALGSRRPYKEPVPLARCFEILEEGRAKHFDPQVLDAFFARTEDVVRVATELADELQSSTLPLAGEL